MRPSTEVIKRAGARREQFEASYRAGLIRNTANALVEVPFQRSERNLTQQTLMVYEAYGATTNPTQRPDYMANMRERTALMIREKAADLPTKELEYMGMLLPDLTAALFLDEYRVGKVYEKDLPEAFDIAMDWFMFPDMIDQTQLRIGFGGEEVVNGRAPAYLSSAIETVKRVKNIQARYGNWAISHELHDVTGKDRADDLNARISQRIQAVSTDPNAQKDWMSEIQNPEFTNPQDVRRVLVETWKEFTGEEPNIDELQEKYHFTDKAPKIVVFNAANAAIEIDKMDREKTLAARDQTQALLQSYVEEFHPEAADSIEFQNDRPWSEHDYYTQMLIYYAGDVLNRFDGKRDQIAERLHQFGEHHQRDEHDRVMGLKPSELYGRLHPFFFMDPLRPADDAEKLPTPAIMQPVDPARNVIWHQGPPEVVFGAYRKVLSENMTVSDFTQWLKQRLTMAHDHSAVIAQINDRVAALGIDTASSQKFNSVLYQAANDIIIGSKKDKQFKGLPDAQKKIIKPLVFDFLKSDTYKLNPDKEAAWREFCDQLEATRPDEPITQIEALIKEMDNPQDPTAPPSPDYQPGHKQRIQNLRRDAYTAVQADDYNAQRELMTRPEAVYALTPNRLELEVPVGEIPVYYPLKDSDAVVWPRREVPSFTQYQENHVRASERKNRVTEINKALERRIIPQAVKNEGSDPVISAYNRDALQKAGFSKDDMKAAIGEDIASMSETYNRIEQLEALGDKTIDTETIAREQIALLVSRRVSAIASQTGQDQQIVRDYVVDEIVPEVMGTVLKQKQQDAVVDVVKTGAVMKDYVTIMASINPGIYRLAVQEEREKEATKGIKDDGMRKRTLDEISAKYSHMRDAAIQSAEARYQTFIKSQFGAAHTNGNGHHPAPGEEFVLMTASQRAFSTN